MIKAMTLKENLERQAEEMERRGREEGREEGSISALLLAGFGESQIASILKIPVERVKEIEARI